MARRHVLGDLYQLCDAIAETVPVFLAEQEPSLVGHVDESLGHYADAFTFHLSDELCKQLSAGRFTYSLDYEYADPAQCTSRSRIRLNSISLVARRGYKKPAPRNPRAAS